MNTDLSNIIIRISSCSNYPETITENLILYIQNNYEEQEVKKLETISNILANINTSLNSENLTEEEKERLKNKKNSISNILNQNISKEDLDKIIEENNEITIIENIEEEIFTPNRKSAMIYIVKNFNDIINANQIKSSNVSLINPINQDNENFEEVEFQGKKIKVNDKTILNYNNTNKISVNTNLNTFYINHKKSKLGTYSVALTLKSAIDYAQNTNQTPFCLNLKIKSIDFIASLSQHLAEIYNINKTIEQSQEQNENEETTNERIAQLQKMQDSINKIKINDQTIEISKIKNKSADDILSEFKNAIIASKNKKFNTGSQNINKEFIPPLQQEDKSR